MKQEKARTKEIVKLNYNYLISTLDVSCWIFTSIALEILLESTTHGTRWMSKRAFHKVITIKNDYKRLLQFFIGNLKHMKIRVIACNSIRVDSCENYVTNEISFCLLKNWKKRKNLNLKLQKPLKMCQNFRTSPKLKQQFNVHFSHS